MTAVVEAPPGGRRRRRGLAGVAHALFLPASLTLIVAAAFIVPLPVFVETPRDAVSLSERVLVDDEEVSLEGDYLLLAVSLRRGTFGRVAHALLDGDRTMVPELLIVPPHEDDGTYFARQRDIFAESAIVAAAVGLSAAGHPVDPEAVTGEGVLVVDVVGGTPAAGGLEPGDIIVEVEGMPVRAFDDLREVIPDEAGASVELVVLRGDAPQRVPLETAELETADGRRAGIGIIGQTHEPRIDLPVPVDVEGGRIGGSSAGLAIALTVYDQADPDVDLAAGRRIAATGRIDVTGQVGGVGGVRQKVVASEAADADVLLVPRAALDRALAARSPGSSLQIIGVGTFEEAVEVLRDGARVTATSG